MSAEWPACRAAVSAVVKLERQPRSRSRSSSVTIWRHAADFCEITPEGCRIAPHPADASARPKRNANRMGRSLGGSPAAVDAEIRSGDRPRFFAAEVERQRGNFLRRDEALG